MRTPAQIAGHPIHPMLVTVPIGLWLFSFVCDLIAMRSGSPQTWSTVALYTMVGGCIGAAAAAIPGLIDYSSLRDSTRRTALAHMILNVTVLVLFAANAVLRSQAAIEQGASVGLSAVAVVLLGISGWLGGKMVYEKGVGVHAEGQEAVTSTAADNEGWTRPGRATQRPATAGSPSWRTHADHAMAQDRAQSESDRKATAKDRPLNERGDER